MRAIGLMSGTSLDGVDVALIESDGETVARRGPWSVRPYNEEERAVLRASLDAAVSLTDREARPGVLQSAESLITAAHAEAVEAFLTEHGIDRSSIDIIGFHGQTVLHRPERALTVQIGDGQGLADQLQMKVVHDLRAADVAAGGQGAPLVPVYHRALALGAQLELPIAILNIGGVANVTFIARDGSLTAFDTGPGNALIDDFVFRRTGLPFDDGGEIAGRGKPDEALLAWLLNHPYFTQKPPKSLDRNWFSQGIAAHLSLENGAATLSEFTARSVARALDYCLDRPDHWVVAGGGARNLDLLRRIKRMADASQISSADALGWSADGMEAEAFAFLAIRSAMTLPLSFPSTTGVPHAMSGGILAEPRRFPAPRSKPINQQG